MASLFSYTTLSISLERTTRSATITLNDPYLSLESLFELESFFTWLTIHPEIEIIELTSTHHKFSNGVNPETLGELAPKMVGALQGIIRRLVKVMHHLPQTVIANMKDGADNLAIELSLGADIRILNDNAEVMFNHLSFAICPSSFGPTLLSHFLGECWTKSAFFTNKKATGAELTAKGFSINADSKNLVTSLAGSSYLARIQMKKTFLDLVRPNLERMEKVEMENGQAVNFTTDYKEANQASKNGVRPQFKSVKEIKAQMASGEIA